MKLPTVILAFALAAQVHLAHVDAHGGMVNPESRAVRTMGLDVSSTFGHPIDMRAGYTNGKGGDCLDFTPDTKLQPLKVGENTVELVANDGANHIGPCKISLVSPSDKSKKLEVGAMNDCMRSVKKEGGKYGDKPIQGLMTIDIPADASKLPCDDGKCVLQFEWTATHLEPNEKFNNCADVQIDGLGGGGGGGGSTPQVAPTPVEQPKTQSPAEKTPAPPPAVSVAPPPPATVAPPPAAGGGGKYKYIGSHPDKVAMDQWCNWNCPAFCVETMCKLA